MSIHACRTARPFLAVLFGVGCAAGLAATAAAQNAHGNGRAMDNNLRRGPQGEELRTNESRGRIVDLVRYQNAISTGDVIGGFGFRGELGYRAAGDFGDDLGSDDIYGFERDSYISGLGGRGVSTNTILSLQNRAALGRANAALPVLQRMGVMRDQENVLSRNLARTFDTRRTVPTPRLLDPSGSNDLRSLLAGMGPRDASNFYGTNQSRSIAETSSRLGERLGRDDEWWTLKASPLEAVRRTRIRRTRTNDREENDGSPLQIDNAVSGEIEPLRVRVAVLEELRTTRRQDTRLGAATDNNAAVDLRPNAPAPERRNTQLETLEKELEEARAALEKELEERRLERKEQGGDTNTEEEESENERLARRAEAAEDREFFLENVGYARAAFFDGRYFDAERRFTMALRAMPEDHKAGASLVHAQLCAGLYASAWRSLRTMLQDDTFINEHYAVELLPDDPTARRIFVELDERAAYDDNPRAAHGAACMIAYLAWQLDRPRRVEQALDRMNQLDADDAGHNQRLRDAWLTKE